MTNKLCCLVNPLYVCRNCRSCICLPCNRYLNKKYNDNDAYYDEELYQITGCSCKIATWFLVDGG